MITSKIDAAKNRIYIVMEGFLTDAQVKEGADGVIANVAKLRPGFDVINDISKFKPTSPAGTQDIGRVQQFIKEKGPRRIIRVVVEGVAKGQLSRTATSVAHYDKDADTASSVAEAERMLES